MSAGTLTSKFIRRTVLMLASLLLLLLMAGFAVDVGELSIPLQTTFYAIGNKLGLTAVPLNRIHEAVIWDYRLSRARVAACSGAGLAVCGAVLQCLLKNALAETYVPGVSAGAFAAFAFVALAPGAAVSAPS